MFHVKHPTDYLSVWQGEISSQQPGPREDEITLTVEVTHPVRRAGRQIQVTIHRDQLADLLDLAE